MPTVPFGPDGRVTVTITPTRTGFTQFWTNGGTGQKMGAAGLIPGVPGTGPPPTTGGGPDRPRPLSPEAGMPTDR